MCVFFYQFTEQRVNEAAPSFCVKLRQIGAGVDRAARVFLIRLHLITHNFLTIINCERVMKVYDIFMNRSKICVVR